MTPPPILGQDDLIECLRWAAFKMCGRGEHENFASDAITMAIDRIEDLRQPAQSDVLKAAGDAIRGLLDITSDYNLDSEQAGRAYAALHDIDTALKGASK